MLAGLCTPLYDWIARLVRGRGSLAAILTLLLLFFLVAGPISAFVGIVVAQAINVSDQALPWVQQHFGPGTTFNAHDWLVQRFPALAPYVPEQTQILETVGRAAKATGAFLVASATKFTAGTAAFLLNLFVMLYAMFFFFRDGKQIVEKIFYYMPLSHEDEMVLLERLTSVTRATIKGTVVIGIIQGALAGLGFWVAGIDGSAFWGTIMAILSIVPGIGPALVWVPAVIYLFITGQTLTATLLLAWCAGVVGTIDNILRPRARGERREDARPSHSDWHAGRPVPLRPNRFHCRADRLRSVPDRLGNLWRDLQRPSATRSKPSLRRAEASQGNVGSPNNAQTALVRQNIASLLRARAPLAWRRCDTRELFHQLIQLGDVVVDVFIAVLGSKAEASFAFS